jgi:hypothetical protein
LEQDCRPIEIREQDQTAAFESISIEQRTSFFLAAKWSEGGLPNREGGLMPDDGSKVTKVADLSERPKSALYCPSAQPGLNGSLILAVVNRSSATPQVSYLDRPAKVTAGTLLAFTAGGARPTAMFRFAAPCKQAGCHNWSGSTCRVAEHLVHILPAANQLPNCKLMPVCRWFAQEGASACLRCPQAITDDPDFEAAMAQVAPAHSDARAESLPLSEDLAHGPKSNFQQKGSYKRHV